MSAGPTRVLLVDDDEDDFRRTRSLLARADSFAHRLEWVDGYEAGLEAVCRGGYDVCLLDYRLGERTGLELLGELATRGCGAPVILLTGQSDGQLDLESLKAGAADYLKKDELTPALLDRSIRYAIERARATEQLQRSHAFLQSTLDALSAHIALLAAGGPLVAVNAVWRHFARENGFRGAATDVGMNYLDVCETAVGVGAVEARAVAKGIRDVVARQCREFSLEYPCHAPDEARWFVVRVTRFESAGGNRIVLAHENVTDRKRTEEELLEREQELRQSQKLEAVGQLAGGIAHDFNNLLTVISGYSDMVLRRLDDVDPLRRDVLEIRDAGERAAALTNQLLAFSRKQVMQVSLLDLNAIIRDLERMLRRLINEDIDLVTSLEPELAPVHADRGKLEQVIVNLVINARDAMPKGGGLTVTTANVTLDDAYARGHAPLAAGSYVLMSVCDAGCGMSPETRARVFEPFFTTKERGKGTGLGLATVYGIVKQSNGYIWVESEVGRGTTVEVHLPCAPDDSAVAPAAVVSPEKIEGGGETVLLVEDEAGVRAFARRVLEMHGYDVLEAESGEEALRLVGLHGGCVDLLVTDVVMPKMSGRELEERLMPHCPRLRVLYMSGYTDDAIVHHGVLDAGVALLEKPFTPDAMARKVRAVLDAP